MPKKITYCNVSHSSEAFLLKEIAEQNPMRSVIFVANDEKEIFTLKNILEIIAPLQYVQEFLPWDTVPYDRISPDRGILGSRAYCFSQIASGEIPHIILTTSAALCQMVPCLEEFNKSTIKLKENQELDLKTLHDFLHDNGYRRLQTVHEQGEYALRGDIVDIYPSGVENPLRIDFFGDQIEAIKSFDPLSQRTIEKQSEIFLHPTSELFLKPTTIENFRKTYRQQISKNNFNHEMYQSVSDRALYPGIEQYVPMFYDRLCSFLDYFDQPMIVYNNQLHSSYKHFYEQVVDHYQARQETDGDEVIASDCFYQSHETFCSVLETIDQIEAWPFEKHDLDQNSRDYNSTYHSFQFDSKKNQHTIESLKEYIKTKQKEGKRIVLALYSQGAVARLEGLLHDHQFYGFQVCQNWEEIGNLKNKIVALTVLPLERGFESKDRVIITEQDLFGERVPRQIRRTKRSDLFIQETSNLHQGDYVVHQDHGVARYDGLHTIEVLGVPHDCIRLIYHGDDKLFLPIENLEILSRYGGDQSSAQLDKLGSASWQSRKSKVKKELLEIAGKLIDVAAQRALKPGDVFESQSGLTEEFAATFPYQETPDQMQAIEATLSDLKSGKSMDRLICGDVGFGKTEVAIRAAFTVASSNKQVAIIAPTTLLCRQHYLNFKKRFEDFGLSVEQLSRFVSPQKSKVIKERIQDGTVDIVIGTHALLSSKIAFHDVGLVIIDEEQHFGVKQKEKLKELQKDVHVLTLTATPIPRTLQMSLTGVRDLSIIATPPQERLAVKSFVLPFDELVIKEAILREIHRGGQVYYVCPRIDDLGKIVEKLNKILPDLKMVVAHGQMTTSKLEEVMEAFMNGQYDVLLSTNIIESGIDIATANTMIVHRSDLFGLSQLYQLKGRVGRGKRRAYAYFTVEKGFVLQGQALKRLEVIQTLDTLGAGFQLASYDLDIRGAGNLLGAEQSGHIKEIGAELYQQMLQDAILELKGNDAQEKRTTWTPVIHIGLPVLIPDTYVQDLSVRLSLYKRLSALTEPDEIHDFKEEIVDRFGACPEEVNNLLEIIALKLLCRKAHVEKIKVGEKGASIQFREKTFANPMGLLDYIKTKRGMIKVKPDQSLTVIRAWKDPQQQLRGLKTLITELAEIAKDG